MTEINYTVQFQEWFEKEQNKSKVQIQNRFNKIKLENHFGDTKSVNDEVHELRWKNGRRVYYSFIVEKSILVILWGNKNGQKKDIKQAKKIYYEYKKTFK